MRALFGKSTEPGSFGYKARQRRMDLLVSNFPDFADMRVVDLGGDARFWRSQAIRPAHVTLVALEEWAVSDTEPWMSSIVGDACLPETIPGSFDLVFSNSVIEHVGGPRYRRGFAENVHRLAPRHWVQTPYRYFPYEPHFRFPGFQFLPLAAQLAVARRWPANHIAKNPQTPAVPYIRDHDLLTKTEMRDLFETSDILVERFAGLPKSLIAIKK